MTLLIFVIGQAKFTCFLNGRVWIFFGGGGGGGGHQRKVEPL